MEEEFDNAIDIDEQTENLKNISLKTPSNNRWRFFCLILIRVAFVK